MAQKLFKGISVITAGPALGHGMVIDAETLDQVVQAGNDLGQVKVLSDHSSSVSNIIGYLENFTLDGGRVRADLTLFESHEGFSYFSELISTLPGQIGFSISFSGVPRLADDGTQLATVNTLFSIDLVLTPAANPTGVYSARVDTKKNLNMETSVKESAPVIEAAPVTPAAPETKFAEPALSDLSAKLDVLSAKLDTIIALQQVDIAGEQGDEAPEPAMAAKVDETKLSEPEVKAEEPKAEEAKTEEAAAEAPAEVVEVAETNLSKNDEAGAKAELANLKIELEASRGIKPLETASSQPISRDEILKAFNAEKDPRRAAEIFKQLKFARK
jgi:hypothetical protein